MKPRIAAVTALILVAASSPAAADDAGWRSPAGPDVRVMSLSEPGQSDSERRAELASLAVRARSVEELADGLEAAFRDSLLRLGANPTILDAATAASESGANAAIASFADLDGDNEDDVLVLRSRPDADGPQLRLVYADRLREDSWSLEARRGRDGALLWAADLPARSWPIPLVGSDGSIQILVFSREILATATAARMTTRLVALDGQTGHRLWSRTFEGAIAFAGYAWTWVGIAFPTGLFDAADGQATDVLIDVIDMVNAAAGTWHLTTQVLDGRDGTTAASVRTVTAGAMPMSHAAGDLNGDDLADLVVVQPFIYGSGTVAAYRGSDGSELWRRGELDLPGQHVTTNPGDTDGDGLDDVAVGGTGGSDAPPLVSLLSGADGTLLWAQPVGLESSWTVTPFATGDLTGDGRAEVGSIWDVPEQYERDPLWGFRYVARDHEGNVVYDATYGLGLPDVRSGFMIHREAGDVDDDGTLDRFQHVYLTDLKTTTAPDESSTPSPDTKTKLDVRLVSGRTGETIRTRVRGLPLGGSVDGTGDDLAIAKVSGRTLTLFVDDGESGQELWRWTLRQDADSQSPWWVTAHDLTGDGRDEVILVLETETATDNGMENGLESHVLSAQDGQRIWSLP